ncbi:MAG: hypothetical protein ABII10_01945 [Candidatus Paceibacterota bacterium]
MTDFVPHNPILPSSPEKENKIQWKSPILIAGVLVAIIIFGVWLALFISQKRVKENQADGPTMFAPGAKIDQQKIAEKTDQLSTSNPQSSLLVMGSLKTTYSGLLANWYAQEAINPDDVALVLELNKGTAESTVVFEITKAQLAKTRVFSVNSEGTTVISYSQMEVGNGIGITYTTDVRDTTTKIEDEIVIEVTRQSWQ